jgi:hypothetical protein
MYVNAKLIPAETIPGMGEGKIGEIGGRGKIKYDLFNTLQELL